MEVRGDLWIHGPDVGSFEAAEQGVEDNVLTVEALSSRDPAINASGWFTVGADNTGMTLDIPVGSTYPGVGEFSDNFTLVPPSVVEGGEFDYTVPGNPGSVDVGGVQVVDDKDCYDENGDWTRNCKPFPAGVGQIVCQNVGGHDDEQVLTWCELRTDDWVIRAEFGPAGDWAPIAYEMTVSSSIPAVTVTDGLNLAVVGENGASISADENGWSVRRNITLGNADTRFGNHISLDNISLVGGVDNPGNVELAGVTIGSADALSLKGVVAESIAVRESDRETSVEIYTWGTIFSIGEGASLPPHMPRAIYAYDSIYGFTVTDGPALEGVDEIFVYAPSVKFEYPNGMLSDSATGEIDFWVTEWLDTDQVPLEEEFVQPEEVLAEEGVHEDLGYSYEVGDHYVEVTSSPLKTNVLVWEGGFENPHGRIRMVSGYGEELHLHAGQDPMWDLVAGSVVVVEAIPRAGYQFVDGNLQIVGEDGETIPLSALVERGFYSFEMPNHDVEVQLEFAEFSNGALVLDDAVASAALGDLPEGTIEEGTARLTVYGDDEVPEGIANEFEDEAGDLEIGQYLEIGLDEVVLKGTGNLADAWAQPIHDLQGPTTVTLTLDPALLGNDDYTVLRAHNSEVTALATEYDADAGTVTFATDGFSTYAIAYKRVLKPVDPGPGPGTEVKPKPGTKPKQPGKPAATTPAAPVASATATSEGTLPRTGVSEVWLGALGIIVLAAGVVLRRSVIR